MENLELYFFRKICTAFTYAGLITFVALFIFQPTSSLIIPTLVFIFINFLSLKLSKFEFLLKIFVMIQQGSILFVVTLAANDLGGLDGPIRYSFFLIPIVSLLCMGTIFAIIWCVISFLTIVTYLDSSNYFDLFMFGINLFTLFTIFGFFRDMLEKHYKKEQDLLAEESKARSERQSLLNEISQKTRLAEVGGLAAGLAHEINNPLSNIYAGLSILKKKEKLKNPKMLEVISKSANRIAMLSRGLQDLSRTEKIFQNNSLAEIIDEVKNLMIFELREHKINLVVKCGDGNEIYCDQTRMASVFLNLIGNSKDAFVSNSISNREISIWAEESLGSVVVTYSDNAGGMSSEVSAKIFEQFFTTKGRSKGTGIGMHLCKTIVEESKGTINIDSKEGVGTIFTLVFKNNDEADYSKALA